MDHSVSFLNRRWTPRRGPAKRAPALESTYGPRLAALLAARGIATLEEAEAYFDPGLHRLADPFSIAQMDAAADRIAAALRRGEQICIYGDYDVDGQTSVALLYRVLTRLGGRVSTYVPNRMVEGYGLNAEALGRVAARGATLVVTVDCGVTAVAEAEWARRCGLDLVITDHHQPGSDLPGAVALVNPKLGAPDPLRELAGCGVAFKLAEAVAEAMGAGREVAHEYVELAAVGTIADVVPLTGENRSIVRAGLDRLNRSPRVYGLVALKEAVGIEGDVSAGHVGFALGPRLNAAGRINDASAGVELLTTEERAVAVAVARRLNEENEERRRIERRILEEAERFVEERFDPEEAPALVAWGEGWHPGVVGIVASRVVERYYRPAVILAVEGELARGSGRSIAGLNLYEALSECRELFEAFGGHDAAAGLTIRRERLEAFAEMFTGAVARRVGPGDLTPLLEYDDVLELDELSLDFAEKLAAMEPFGVANPAPVLVCTGVSLSGRPVGKDGSHLKLSISSPGSGRVVGGIGFGMAAKVGPLLEAGALYDVAFVLGVNEWSGRRSVSAEVQDVRPHRGAPRLGAELVSAALGPGALEAAAARADLAGRDRVSVRVSGDAPPWSVVDCRGQAKRRVLESILPSGRPTYLIPGVEGAAAAGSIAAWGYGERTAVLDERLGRELPASTARAFSRPGWIAVLPEPPGPVGGPLLWEALAGEAEISVVLWELPGDVRELDGHLSAVRRPGLAPRLYLAFHPREGTPARLEWIARRLPDRERLGRLYVALKGAAGEGGALAADEARGALEARWPGLLDPGGLENAIDIFRELGLMRQEGGRYRLVPQRPGAKVDLERSLLYNECTRIRELLVRSHEALDEAPPDQFLNRLSSLTQAFETFRKRAI